VGYGSDGWLYLIMAVTFLSMALMYLIQLLRREKE
jgi:TRAP-type C4-dicarboxylate transport system permease small subunit